MSPDIEHLFSQSRTKPVIAVIHLLPLPGAPGYKGNMKPVYGRALKEAEIFAESGVDGLIIENFGDTPFYPDKVPNETIAAMAAVGREIRNVFQKPLGINVLRNDATAAVSIAAAIQANFIRVNVHMGATVTDQGIVQTRAWETLRLIHNLRANIQVFADVAVKHAAPLTNISLEMETRDLAERGNVNALIVSGTGTGQATRHSDLKTVRENSGLPVLIGSGVNHDNIKAYFPLADAFIVGSCFKEAGNVRNEVDAKRVSQFMELMEQSAQ